MQPSVIGKNRAGLSVIELLIAMAIFAVLSVMTMVALRQMIPLSHKHERVVKALEQSQLAYVWLQRDLLGAIAISGTEKTLSIHLSAVPPFHKVEYRLEGLELIRQHGSNEHILMDGVKTIKWHYHNEETKPYTQWTKKKRPLYISVDLSPQELGTGVWAFPLS
jgi:prepilin-type N-terminal cleavage/methylation domain-containing protein